VKWSFLIARVSGIGVRVHVTFLLLIAWYAYGGYTAGGVGAAVSGVGFILLLFLCVLLHEFGHAFAARAFGIRTPDITLLPIGGVARLERMPSNPMQELLVAVAGPAVNVAIAAVLAVPLFWSGRLDGPAALLYGPQDLLARLLEVNVILVLFNLIPAFPMDGGRILRALLATRLNHATATRIAGRTGQGIAILFGIAGFFGNPFLLLIAAFVFMGAQQELEFATFRQMSAGLSAGEAMISRFQSLPAAATAAQVLPGIAGGTQEIFPVVDDWMRPIGVVSRAEIAAHAGAGNTLASFSGTLRGVPSAASLRDASEMLGDGGWPVLAVLNGAGQIVGLLTPARLAQLSGGRSDGVERIAL